MSATAVPPPPSSPSVPTPSTGSSVEATPGTRRVLGQLVRLEARRHLRSPLLWLALPVCAWWVWELGRQPWSGAWYQALPNTFTPLLVVVSVLVARSFHRERAPYAETAPVGQDVRATARLLGTWPVVALIAVATAAGATWLRRTGGVDLGDEPGRTLHAHFTLPELLQPLCLVVLAVALGAVVGRRLPALAGGVLVLALFWLFVGGLSWAFQSAEVTSFSVVQTQPVKVGVGPLDSDPTAFPDTWLLSAPGEYQAYWGRLVVSAALAFWHDLWLLALATVAAACSYDGRPRWRGVALGVTVAALAVVMQLRVIP